MITCFQSSKIHRLADVKEAMAKQIRQLPQMIGSRGAPMTILRYEFPCENISLTSWLHNQRFAQEKIYWADRNGQDEIAAVGIADIIEGAGDFEYKQVLEYIEDHLTEDSPRLRYYGGFSFSNQAISEEWSALGSYRFIVPQFELTKFGNQLLFAFNIAVTDVNDEFISNVLNTLTKIDFTCDTHYRSVPAVLSREDFPNQKDWGDAFSRIKENILGRSCEKIVLARRSIFKFDKDIDPVALIKHLRDKTPNCYHFCFQTSAFHGFLGATPERLFKQDRMNIESEAMAGTISRSVDVESDNALSKELLNSKKNAHEHKFVVDAVHESLTHLCSSIEKDKSFSLVKLTDWQHLITRFKGTLQEKVYTERILSLLHPTPAVAGYPTKEAIEAIQETEPFQRGWYAGPVGYVGFNCSEFAVAIRCGLIDKEKLSLYAGAGIVEGSTAEDEWNEIENKIQNFLKVFYPNEN